MKRYFLIFLMVTYFQSCTESKKQPESLDEFRLKTYNSYCFSNDIFRKFVEDYVSLPENIERKVFTLYMDQRMDTLLFTIWRNPDEKIELENSFGYFKCKKKVVIIYSPFFTLLEKHNEPADKQLIIKLFDEELEYYKTHEQKLVMWQLQIPYHGGSSIIQKDFNMIFNTTKAPSPKSEKVGINYQPH